MGDEAKFDRAIGLVYEAVLQPELLQDALDTMTELLTGDNSHLFGRDRGSGQPSLSLHSGLELDWVGQYADIAQFRQLAPSVVSEGLPVGHEDFDADFLGGNEVYRDQLLPKGGGHFLMGAHDLLPESADLIQLGFQRSFGRGPFSQDDAGLLERLLPHVKRALGLLEMRRFKEDQQQLAFSALDLSRFAMFALAAGGELLHANARGEALLRSASGLSLRHGVLCATPANQDAMLRAAILEVGRNGLPHHLNIASGTGVDAAHCYMTLMAAPRFSTIGLLGGRVAIVALVAESKGGRLATARQLMELFDLTPAEARLVRALTHGDSVEGYAAHQGLKLSTVRTQLRSALAKTGTAKQKDLVRLVLMVPAVRG